jgi:hypothetical protein
MMMPGGSFLRLFLWGVAATASVGGAVASFLPPSVSVSPVSPVVPILSEAGAMAATDNVAEEIVMANIFSPSRSAPSNRYTPPELSPETAPGTMMPPMDARGIPDSALASGDVPQIFGTLVGALGHQALLQLSLASGPRLYAVGDRDGGFTVLAIDPRAVVLRGPGGRRTLRLEPEE